MDVGLYTMFGKRTPQGQAKFRGEAATLSLTHWDSTPRPLGRQSRALTTALERATCGKLRCRGPFSSFLTNPFICFECYSNIERINEGCEAWTTKPNSGNPPLAQPISGLVTATCFDWPTGMPTFARVVCHPVKNTQELPQLYLLAWLPSYSAKERPWRIWRRASDIVASERVVIFVIRNVAVTVA